MSISDELMWRYFELLSFRPLGKSLHCARYGEDQSADVKFELGAGARGALFTMRAPRMLHSGISLPRQRERVLPTCAQVIPWKRAGSAGEPLKEGGLAPAPRGEPEIDEGAVRSTASGLPTGGDLPARRRARFPARREALRTPQARAKVMKDKKKSVTCAELASAAGVHGRAPAFPS